MECEVCGEVVVWSVVPESSAALQLRSAQPGRPPPAPLKAFCAAGRPALSPPHYTTLSAHRTGTPAPALRHCHFSTSFSQSLQSDITQTRLLLQNFRLSVCWFVNQIVEAGCDWFGWLVTSLCY